MAFVHGKDTVVTLDDNDLSLYTKTSEVTDGADEHDITGYGADGHAYQGGLRDAKVTISGTYFAGASGPRATIRPLLGTNVTFVRQPEGAGTTKPQDSATVHVKSYVETNPVADMIAWSAELTVSGVIDDSPQA